MHERTKDFKWRYQTPFDSDKAKMLTYLQNQDLHPSQDKSTMIMSALTTYYMALALYSLGNYPREKLELVFLDSVNAIANHLKFTCAVLGIDTNRPLSVLCSEFEGLSSKDLPNNQSASTDTLDEFDPHNWNLAGITTDNEAFD